LPESEARPRQVFDGHNDVLMRLWQAREKRSPVDAFRNEDGRTIGHIDLPKAAAGGLAGGLCAMFVPSGHAPDEDARTSGPYEIAMAPPLRQAQAAAAVSDMVQIAADIEGAGLWRLCRTAQDIEAAMATGVFAAVLHLEGCEAIGPTLDELPVLYEAGLRSLGPVWSRHNLFGHGVPFAFPRSPDTGPGLTGAGKALVRACDELGILVDVSHLTERGFWDVAETSSGPLVATHSNAHALVPITRNLTDRQLDAIRERGGMVGLNFAVTMLRSDGREDAAVPLSQVVRHIDYLVERLGPQHVALGSDFDGATVPAAIGDASGLPALIEALSAAGYDEATLDAICRTNWLRVLRKIWGR
jgi:membrane dipeptidase